MFAATLRQAVFSCAVKRKTGGEACFPGERLYHSALWLRESALTRNKPFRAVKKSKFSSAVPQYQAGENRFQGLRLFFGEFQISHRRARRPDDPKLGDRRKSVRYGAGSGARIISIEFAFSPTTTKPSLPYRWRAGLDLSVFSLMPTPAAWASFTSSRIKPVPMPLR